MTYSAFLSGGIDSLTFVGNVATNSCGGAYYPNFVYNRPIRFEGCTFRSVERPISIFGDEERPLPPAEADGRTAILYENDSTREIKFFGYALK